MNEAANSSVSCNLFYPVNNLRKLAISNLLIIENM